MTDRPKTPLLDRITAPADMKALSDRELRERLKLELEASAVHKLISEWEPLKSVA